MINRPETPPMSPHAGNATDPRELARACETPPMSPHAGNATDPRELARACETPPLSDDDASVKGAEKQPTLTTSTIVGSSISSLSSFFSGVGDSEKTTSKRGVPMGFNTWAEYNNDRGKRRHKGLTSAQLTAVSRAKRTGGVARDPQVNERVVKARKELETSEDANAIVLARNNELLEKQTEYLEIIAENTKGNATKQDLFDQSTGKLVLDNADGLTPVGVRNGLLAGCRVMQNGANLINEDMKEEAYQRKHDVFCHKLALMPSKDRKEAWDVYDNRKKLDEEMGKKHTKEDTRQANIDATPFPVQLVYGKDGFDVEVKPGDKVSVLKGEAMELVKEGDVVSLYVKGMLLDDNRLISYYGMQKLTKITLMSTPGSFQMKAIRRKNGEFLKVEASTPVSQLRALIQKTQLVKDHEVFCLYYKGKLLSDDAKALSDYHLVNDAEVKIEVPTPENFSVFVAVGNVKYPFDVTADMKVEELQKLIVDKRIGGGATMELHLGSMKLAPGQPLAYYKLQDGDEIKATLPDMSFPITLKHGNQTVVYPKAKASTKVSILKQHVVDAKIAANVAAVKLSFNDLVLDGSKKLSHYNMQTAAEVLIELVTVVAGAATNDGFQVNIKKGNQTTLFAVKASTKVSELKQSIVAAKFAEDIATVTLIHNGKVMEDSKKLSAYKVKAGDEVKAFVEA